MAMPSSPQIKASPVDMPVDVFKAAIKGDSDVLIRRLARPELEQTEIQLTIDAAPPTSQQIEADQRAVQDVLGSVTHFGDTLLHLLVTKKHNKLAVMVFERNRSLMKVRNKDRETPLHCAAKVGNEQVIQDLIERAREVVEESVRETNNNQDTALHLAAIHGHVGIARELMGLDKHVAYMVNEEEYSPLYIATVRGYTTMVMTMLNDDPSLACQQYLNGMCPVHVAARVGNTKLVEHFIEECPDDAELLDRRGQNVFHSAAEENKAGELIRVLELQRLKFAAEDNSSRSKLDYRLLIKAKDYEGNTPLHVAAMKGHALAVQAICETLTDDECAVQNNQGLTPFDLSLNQIMTKASKDMQWKINSYVKNNGPQFTPEWFDIMQPYENKWDRIQLIGLGSVLITTVTFAAAFTIPGGYNQDHGIPILGRKYAFKAFILANTQSFIQAFISLLTLVLNALSDSDAIDIRYATYTFIAAAGCMVLAFGLGSYVILAPVSLPIAIIVLVYSLLLGSPFMYHAIEINKYFFGDDVLNFELHSSGGAVVEVITASILKSIGEQLSRHARNFITFLNLDKLVALQILGVSLLGIFLLALA